MSISRKEPKINGLYNLSILLDFELDPIEAFIEETVQMIDEKSMELNRQYIRFEEEFKKRKPEPYNGDFGPWTAFDHFEDDFIKLSEFSPILYNSIFIAIYSKFETSLYKVCQYCQYCYELKIGAKDLSERNYIIRAKKYLEKVIEVDLDKTDEIWKNISMYQRIRNVFVHENGKRKITDSNLLKFIKDYQGISYDEVEQEIKIETKDFVLGFCSEFRTFMNVIIEEIITQKINSN